MVLLVVRNPLTGSSCQLGDVPPERSVAELKVAIQQHWQVPPRCQKLLIIGRLLAEDEKLADVYPDSALDVALTIDMIVSVAELVGALNSGTWGEKVDALQTLSLWHLKADEDVVLAVVGLLSTANDKTHSLAVKTLASIVQKGDPAIVSCVTAQLACEDARSRLAAVRALPEIVSQSDEAVTAALIACLDDIDPRIRLASYESVAKVAVKGHEATVAALLPRLRAGSPQYQCAAVKALASLANVEDEVTIAALIDRLYDDWDVQGAALAALECVAPRGHKATVAAVIARIKHDDGDPWCIAFDGLGRLAEGREGAFPNPRPRRRIWHGWSRARCAAVHALVAIAGEGHEAATAALLDVASDCPGQAKQAATDAMRKVSAAERVTITSRAACVYIPFMAELLASGVQTVRVAAIAALERVVQKGHKAAIALLTSILNSEREVCEARAAAAKALGKVAEKGDCSAMATLIYHLKDADRQVRLDAVQGLVRVSEKSHEPTIAALISCFEEEARGEGAKGSEFKIRTAVRDALRKLV